MNKEISYDNFKSEVEIRIREQLTPAKQCFFSWLCAVRSLPFLSIKRNFSYWNKDEIYIHLQSIFYALDFVRIKSLGDLHAVFVSIDDAAYAAYAAYDDAAYAAASAAVSAASAALAAYDASAGLASFGKVAEASAGAAFASAAAYSAGNRNLHTQNLKLNYQNMILNDIEIIRDDKYILLQNNISIYGELWSNFLNDLTAIGCGYWARLYDDIFTNQFSLSQNSFNSIKNRLKVPHSIRERGAAAVAEYLENAEKQGVVFVQRETRLIILGSAGAGKTTLVKRLNGDHSYPTLEESTHGVDTNIILDCNGIKTHVWDFGGQVIYHASHRCFLSENCVYILVVNARTEDNRDSNRINYWLDTIRVYSGNMAKVFIVINESDNRVQNVDDYDSFKRGDYGSLIQEIYSFNIGKDIQSVNEFKNDLAVYIETTGHQIFGQNDSQVAEEIKDLFSRKKQILKADELECILSNNGIKKRTDKERVKELLNTLGIALSYDFIQSYVIDPYWVSHGVYKVIDYLQKCNSKFINYNDLDSVFEDERSSYPEDRMEYILQLMENHKIGFRNKGGVRGLIVPCAASQFKPKDVIINPEPDNLMIYVERDDLKEFPADFFYRYICANENDIKRDASSWAMWQTGMILAEEHASALVQLIENRRIEITVWGEGKKEYSKQLESYINDLLHEYSFSSYKNKLKKGENSVTIITLVFEIVKAVIETFSVK